MKISLLLTLAAICSALNSLSAAPSIAALGVKNSASYANPGFQNGAIAQGSLFVVFGSGMGPAQIQSATSFPLPTTLVTTSASVTVNGTTRACIMIYTQDAQIAAILPSTVPTGTGTITVSYNGATSPTAPIIVAANSPGLFTRNQQGSGPAVVQDVNAAYNSYTNAFKPGQTVTFWGTGLGPIAGDDSMPPPTGNLPGTNVTALIGGQSATVSYAGRSNYAGVDQINVTIPSGVSGCFVSVGFFVNNVPSNFTSIAVSTTGAICSDPNLFTSADIQNVAGGNPMRLGTALLSQFTATGTILGLPLKVDYETGKSYYQKYTPDSFLNSLSTLADLAVSSGSCAVFQFQNGAFTDPVPSTGLDAGAAINLTSGGTANPMAKSVTGHYQATFVTPNPLGSSTPSVLKPGSTLTLDDGNGGADVGSFKFNITQPPAITWNNKPTAATISRSQDLKITWTGGDPASYVYVLGQSPIDTANQTGAEFVCVAPNSDGGLTVPESILSALPPSSMISEFGFTVPGGLLTVNTTTVSRQTAPGLDVFLVGASTGDAKGAFTFQ
jgi:uncharacterized protein (TIGR03437 family)